MIRTLNIPPPSLIEMTFLPFRFGVSLARFRERSLECVETFNRGLLVGGNVGVEWSDDEDDECLFAWDVVAVLLLFARDVGVLVFARDKEAALASALDVDALCLETYYIVGANNKKIV